MALEADAQPTCTVPSGKEREHNFQPGDNVEVCEGELINLQGKVLSVDGNKITIMPKHEDLKVMPRGWSWQVVYKIFKDVQAVFSVLNEDIHVF